MNTAQYCINKCGITSTGCLQSCCIQIQSNGASNDEVNKCYSALSNSTSSQSISAAYVEL